MARCHQSHNIPWLELVKCFELVQYPNNPKTPFLRAKPCHTDSEEQSRLTKKVLHFICRMEATIADFATTERRKYDMISILRRETLFDDRFLSDILTPKYQSLDFWRSRQRLHFGMACHVAEEGSVINELFHVDNMEAILLLVHTGVGIQDLENKTVHQDKFGFFNLAEECRWIYVLLNHLIASGDIEHPHRWHSAWKNAVELACDSGGFRAAEGNVLHRVLKGYLTGTERGFVDYSAVSDLLKYCFRILYQYKMISKEIHGKFTPEHLLPSSFDSCWTSLWFPCLYAPYVEE